MLAEEDDVQPDRHGGEDESEREVAVSQHLVDQPDGDGVDEEEDVGFLACAGLEFMLNENLELFAEYRYTFIEYDFEHDGGDAAVEEAEDYEFGLIRVGLNLVL